MQVSYGANIAKFPAGGHLFKGALNDVSGGANTPGTWAAFGFVKVRISACCAPTHRAMAVTGPVDNMPGVGHTLTVFTDERLTSGQSCGVLCSMAWLPGAMPNPVRAPGIRYQASSPRHTTPHHTTPHHTTPHHTTPHRTTPHHTAPHHTTPHHTTPHRTTPHHTAPHHTTRAAEPRPPPPLLQVGKGSLAMFSDSNCLDSSHQHHNCFDFLTRLLEQAVGAADAGLADQTTLLQQPYTAPNFSTPKRRDDVNFTEFSFVLQHPLRCHTNAPCQLRKPGCEGWGPGKAAAVVGGSRDDGSAQRLVHQEVVEEAKAGKDPKAQLEQPKQLKLPRVMDDKGDDVSMYTVARGYQQSGVDLVMRNLKLAVVVGVVAMVGIVVVWRGVGRRGRADARNYDL